MTDAVARYSRDPLTQPTASFVNFILGNEPVDFNSPTAILRFYEYVAELLALVGETVEPMAVNESDPEKVPDLMIVQALAQLMKVERFLFTLENPDKSDFARIYGLLMVGFVADMEKTNPSRAQNVLIRFINTVSTEARQQQGAKGGHAKEGVEYSIERVILNSIVKLLPKDRMISFVQEVKPVLMNDRSMIVHCGSCGIRPGSYRVKIDSDKNGNEQVQITFQRLKKDEPESHYLDSFRREVSELNSDPTRVGPAPKKS